MKICTNCGKQNDSEFKQCAACREYSHKYRQKHHVPGCCSMCFKPLESDKFKVCDKCREYMRLRMRKERETKYKEGLCSRCYTPLEVGSKYKQCEACRKLKREWAHAQPLEAKQKKQAYAREYTRNYARENHEWSLECSRKFRRKNPGYSSTYMHEWKKKYPERNRMLEHNRRVRKQGNGGTYTPQEEMELFAWQEGRCHYCGEFLYTFYKPGRTPYHIEHKTPVTRGGSNNIENIALACPKCDGKKYNKTEKEFLEFLAHHPK